MRIITIAATAFLATAGWAAQQTWTGKISDSMCGATHAGMSESHAGGKKKVSDRECTLACVKDHGGKYVFVQGGKVYQVANQDYAGLAQHAGHTVRLTGEMSGDSITVSKIEMPGAKAKKGKKS